MKTSDTPIKELANQLHRVGIEVEGVPLTYAKWCADLMKADGVKAEQVTPELALSYLEVVGKKIENIQTVCLTRQGASAVVAGLVLNLLRPNLGYKGEVDAGCRLPENNPAVQTASVSTN